MIYSERNNGAKKQTFEVIKSLVNICINNIFFSPHWSGTQDTYSKIDIVAFFMEKTHKPNFNIFLFESCVKNDDDLFDMIEVVILFLSTKVNEDLGHGRYSDNWKDSNCGKFVGRMNEILPSYGYKINQSGELERIPDDGMVALIDQSVDTDESERFEDKIEEAKSSFFRRDGNIETRKSACAKLVDVIDYIRPHLKGSELNTEIGDLMNSVNNVDIRHSKKATRMLIAGNNDDENFVDWVFYSLLNCINYYLKSFHKK